MVEQAYKICRCARSKPEVAQLALAEGVKHAERVVDVCEALPEMVAVILLPELFPHLLRRHALLSGHIVHNIMKHLLHLVLGYAAQGLEAPVHAYVGRLVEAAEHAYLREFRHACKQHKLKVCVGCLERGVESFKNVAVILLYQNVLAVGAFRAVAGVKHVEQRLVILVYEHHAALACGVVYVLKHMGEAVANALAGYRHNAIVLLPF